MDKNILILEDHLDAQQWLSNAVKIAYGETTNITIADTIAKFKEISSRLLYDLYLIDLNLPDGSGIDAIHYVKKVNRQSTCIVTTIYSNDSHLFPSLRAGASGYILKDESKEKIAEMLINLKNNIPAISAEIADRLLSYFHEPQATSEKTKLTDRENETLIYIAKGYSVKKCAQFMKISHHTVSGYVKEIYRKLDISSRAELTSEAMKMGVID